MKRVLVVTAAVAAIVAIAGVAGYVTAFGHRQQVLLITIRRGCRRP